MRQCAFFPTHLTGKGEAAAQFPALSPAVLHLGEQFGLNINRQRQRTALPVTGNQCIERLFHLFKTAQTMFRVPVQAGNALRHGRVHTAVPGQQAQEGTHVWRCRQTSTALAGILHGHDGLQRSLSGWLQGDKGTGRRDHCAPSCSSVLMILAQEYPSVSRHAINASVWEINAGLNSSMLRTTENGWPARVTKTIIQRSLNSPGLQTATSKWQWAGEKRTCTGKKPPNSHRYSAFTDQPDGEVRSRMTAWLSSRRKSSPAAR